MKISTVALLLVTVLGTVAFNPARASAAEVNNRLANQQNHNSVVDRNRLESQRIAEQRAHEQQQRIAAQNHL
ncbi:hypothetical protein [Pseudanabaena sp. BC1403]|uniref:hypothetical protein n=1 Tax=Pseudanabaena sp. BC1403 TaxID=2043171 RepID=UPI000CD82544|nr:hypothetical protein [Pseudanabaena sp. BC1403]